jgi:hypothetical protein
MSEPETNPAKVPVSRTNRRDVIIAIVCGIGVLAFVIYGIMSMRSQQRETSHATLSGKIVEKSFKPAPEEKISFGKKGLKSEHIAGEYILRVHVDRESRTFDVPVVESTYNSVSVGDTFTFGRPPSEQKP